MLTNNFLSALIPLFTNANRSQARDVFGSSIFQFDFMWCRKVFDQPITIAVGETKSFVIDLF